MNDIQVNPEERINTGWLQETGSFEQKGRAVGNIQSKRRGLSGRIREVTRLLFGLNESLIWLRDCFRDIPVKTAIMI